jgi:pyruvate dehydrogenase E2 component (dihydrolipoamide acetyltransferase)
MDVPSPAAGTVKEVKVKVGDAVSEGTLIILLEGGAAAQANGAAAAAAAPAPAAAPAAAAPAAAPAARAVRSK